MEDLSKDNVHEDDTDGADSMDTGASEHDIYDWIKANFHKKECVRHMPSENDKDKCECGRREKDHNSTLTNQDPNVQKEPTDAFGNILFTNNGNKAQYLRLADDTDPKLILKLLGKWGLQTPELVISIIGGRKNFKLNREEKRSFQKAIKEVSQTKKTWVLTGGTNCGAARCTGKAFATHHYSPRHFLTPKGSATCIGIAPWGYVENAGTLVDKHNAGNEVTYSVDERHIPRGQPAPLSPTHTHFILVDDGTKKPGCDQQLRLKIEDALIRENIPLVVILLEGGKDAIDYVCQCVQQDVPVIICGNTGTGRAAGLLSKLYWNQELETDDNRMKELMSQVDVKKLKQICRTYKEFFSVFDVGSDMHDVIKTALLQDEISNDNQEKERHLKRWIKRKFKKVETIQTVPSSDDTVPVYGPPNPPTDAFGEVTFIPSFDKHKNTAKYVRLAVDTDPVPIKELLQKKWQLPTPKLVISVIGGSKNLSLKHEDKRNFNEALKKASQTTSTWIFTNGSNCGVTKCVGDAVREGQSLKWENGKPVNTINCIGITPWGYVDESHSLIEPESHDSDGVRQVEYHHDKMVLRGKPVPLNPNHTHFLLVDDGRKTFGADLKLRPKLEKSIFKDDVPLVLIVLEGGEDAVNHVVNSIEQGVSVVLCKNTGRAADVLSHIATEVKHLKGKEPSDTECENIRHNSCQHVQARNEDKGMTKLIEALNEKDVWPKICKAFAKDIGLVTVFEMGKEEVSDLNLAIMNALLFGQHEDTSTQLNLAISWNRADLAKSLFDNTTDVQVTAEHVTKVLLQDKADFLHLFMKHSAFDIEDNASTVLKKVYQDKQIFNDMRQLVINVLGRKRSVRRRIKHTEDNVENLRRDVQKILGFKPDNYLCSMCQQSTHQKRALWFLELFLWAVINGRENVADFCWDQVQDPTIAALAATKILRRMLGHERGLDRVETLQNTIKKNESRATGLIDECYHTDKKLSRGVVENRHPHWKNKTTIEMAEGADSIDFISHPCCTSKLDDDWYGHLDPALNPWWFIPLALTVIFIPLYKIINRELFTLHFRPPQPGTPMTPWYRRAFYFLQAPVTKFWIYTISYVVFLLLYTYLLLFRFDKELQLLDFFLFVWIMTMVFEEIRVIVPETKSVSLKKSFCRWIKDKWNKMDLVMLVIAIIGFGLQFSDATHEWARTLYAANSFIFFTRLLRMFAVSSRLGPNVLMIQKMIVEMLLFLVVLLVFLVSYGVASQALLYPNQRPSVKAIERIFFMPYFQIYGELFLEELMDEQCDAEGTAMCPNQHWLIPIMLGVYLLLGNVLLLNLLIAIFSSVYEEIKKNSVKIWKYEWFFLVGEMKDRPILPPPLIILEHMYRFCRWPFQYRRETTGPSGSSLNRIDSSDLTIFEQDCASRYIRRLKEKEVINSELLRCLQNFKMS